MPSGGRLEAGRGRTILRRALALLASSSRVECRFLDDDEPTSRKEARA
jgi:hypothetical protein